jgi:hypothetical protein
MLRDAESFKRMNAFVSLDGPLRVSYLTQTRSALIPVDSFRYLSH